MFKEYSFSVNEFLEPSKKEDSSGIGLLLVRLLLLEPGTFQSHPNMGVGIVSRFRYQFANRANELKSVFEDQISKYLPLFQGVIINVQEIQGEYYISAEINGVLYGITLDNNFKTTINYKKLSEISGQ